MKYFLSKFLPILMVFFSSLTKQIHCQCRIEIPNPSVNNSQNSLTKDENYSIFGNIIDQESTIKTGELIECEVTETKLQEFNNNDVHVFTQRLMTPEYIFYPASKDKKCFSFEVSRGANAKILLSATPAAVQGQKLEVIFDNLDHGEVVIIQDTKRIRYIEIPYRDSKLRRLWIRWLDDQLIEVGRDTDNNPILCHRLQEKLSVNFIGILSDLTSAEWILHDDAQCGGYNITKKINTGIKCKVVTTRKLNEE